MSDTTETRLPWGQDTITITGRNTGTEALTVRFDGETLPILDYLNHSLNAEYAARYEEIMARYEARLKTGALFDHKFPEAVFTPPKITASQLPAAPADDKTLIETLLKEYAACLDTIKTHFTEYETTVEKWFNTLA